MYTYIGFVMCLFVGSSVAYYPQREAPYNTGPNDPYTEIVRSNIVQEPSQRLFWSNQGSNQVGGTGLWAHLTNKFPFLGNMFGRMELPAEYGVPNQYNVPATQYGVPAVNQVQYYPQQPQIYQQPQQFSQQPQQFYQQPQQFFNQVPQQFQQRFVPSTRDVGITDDAIIVTPPFVPPIPQPAPIPAPLPAPAPIPVPVPVPAPAPIPTQDQGYTYNKPQFRLELPHK